MRAAAIADRIERGELASGQSLPTAAELAEVALSTAWRAVALLKSWV